MRIIVTAIAVGAALAAAGCSKPEQDKVQANANEAASDVNAAAEDVGEDVTEGAKKVGAEFKELTSDPEVKRAAGEVKDALKSMGAAVKDAADDGTTHSTTTVRPDGTTVTTTTTVAPR